MRSKGGTAPLEPPIERHEAARAQALQRVLKGSLADGVVDDGEAFGHDFLHRIDEALLRVKHDVVGAGFAGESGLLFGRDGRDHARAEHLEHLRDEQADAAGARVREHGVAALHAVGVMHEVVRGEALQQNGGGFVEVHRQRERGEDLSRAHRRTRRRCRAYRSRRRGRRRRSRLRRDRPLRRCPQPPGPE